jgi:hypothetical protein
MTGHLLAVAGEDGWWWLISLSLSENADFFNSRFWCGTRKFGGYHQSSKMDTPHGM